jgi:multiple sugar transport system permease protein
VVSLDFPPVALKKDPLNKTEIAVNKYVQPESKKMMKTNKSHNRKLPAIIFLLPGFVTVLCVFSWTVALLLFESVFLTGISSILTARCCGAQELYRPTEKPYFSEGCNQHGALYCYIGCYQDGTWLFVAVLLNQKLRGRTFFRVSYYLPVITSWVIVSLLFTYMLVGGGIS